MKRLTIGDSIQCIDVEDLYIQDEDMWELCDGYHYEVFEVDYEDFSVKVQNEFGNREWYSFERFDLESFSRRRYERNLPEWF
jgi:hypothetical protein